MALSFLPPPWLLAFLGLLVAFLVYGFHPIKRWRYRCFPGPRPWWLFGNLVDIVVDSPEKAYAKWARQYGPGPFVVWMGALPTVMADAPDLARKVLARPARHKIYSPHIGEVERFEDHSMIVAKGDRWRATRNAWSPFFSKDSLARLAPLMSTSASRLAAHLSPAAEEGRAVDIWRELGLMTMDVVGTTAFGVNFDTLGRAGQQECHVTREDRVPTPADRLVACLRTYFATFAMANPLYGLFFMFPELERPIKWLCNIVRTRTFRQDLDARLQIQAVSEHLVREHQAHAAGTTGPTDGAAATAAGGGSTSGRAMRSSAVDPGSFLALIVPHTGQTVAGEALGEQWAANQASMFILGGYETTANLLGFCVYLLAANPDKEAALLAEVDAFGRNQQPTAEALGALPYTQAVVNEALRLFPPGSVAVREARGGMELGGLQVPGDAQIQVPIYSMHRNPRWWRDPEAFLPERFLPGTPEAAEVVPGAFLPFGDGARKCIGWRFALMEAVLSLARLYQQYNFRLTPGQVPLKVKTQLTLGPVDGVHVTVHRRS